MKNIAVSEHRLTEPAKVITDCYGNVISAGERVAFNYCGSVREGIIEGFKSEWKPVRSGVGMMRWWECKFLLLVKNEDGKISKVKNPNSFYIIR